MKEEISILLLEDNDTDVELIRATLEAGGLKLNLKQVDSKDSFESALHAWAPDVIISDYSLPSYNGRSALLAAQLLHPETPFIFYSGTIGEESAIDALKLGASDYVLKENPKRLISAIQRGLDGVQQRERQRKADEKIHSQAQLLDLATDAIIVRNLENRVLFWSKGAERLYGYESFEAEGALVTQLLFRAPASAFLHAKQCTIRDGHWEGELEQITKDKRTVFVLSRWTLVTNSEGAPERILTINSDITEKKQLEKQFLRAQRLESVGTLASGIAHDLNNILAPILMGCGILKEIQPTKEASDLVELLGNSAQRGADIVKQLLTFVRGSDGKRTVVDLEILIKEVCKVAGQTFPRNITTDCIVEPGLSPVRGDSTQLNQVLLNLCINARDAMPNGGKLVVSARSAPPSSILIQVEDSGMGIPSEILDKVFDPFFTTKEPGKGTGLGLSTVLGIVRGHGGTLKVESEQGIGTRFEITLPAAQKTEELDANSPSAPALKGKGELILVIEDEASTRKVLAQALTERGYEVITAEDGSSGIVQFAGNKGRIKLVLTDLMMPGVDGGSLAKAVRRMNPEIRIIAGSGMPQDLAFPEADRIVRKPFSMDELFRAMDELLNQKQPI